MSAGLIAADIASALTSLGSFGYSIYQDQRDYNTATSQYKQQYALQKDALYNGYQIKTEDMAKAGLNPILAGSSGTSSTSSVSNASVSSTPVQPAQFGSMYLAAKQLEQQEQQFESDYALRRQDTYIKLAENARKAGLHSLEKEILQKQSDNLSKTGEQLDADIVGKKLQNWLEGQKKSYYEKHSWSPTDGQRNITSDILAVLKLILGEDFVDEYLGKEGVAGALKNKFPNAKDTVKGAIDSAKDSVSGAAGRLRDSVSDASERAKDKIRREKWNKANKTLAKQLINIYYKVIRGDKISREEEDLWHKYYNNFYISPDVIPTANPYDLKK